MDVNGAVRFFRAAAVLALGIALVACSEPPATLRIVSGPPQANEQVAALLANVAVCHERAAEKSSDMVSQVAALLQNRELRAR